MGELEIKEILNKETGKVIITYPRAKIEELKEFRDYEPIIAEDDCWGRWNQDTVEWLLEPFDVGNR